MKKLLIIVTVLFAWSATFSGPAETPIGKVTSVGVVEESNGTKWFRVWAVTPTTADEWLVKCDGDPTNAAMQLASILKRNRKRVEYVFMGTIG